MYRTLGPLLLIGLLVFLAPLSQAARAAGSLAGKTIVLDPGEGGSNPGGMSAGVTEKALNLATALDAGALLTRQGAQVLYTRRTDASVSLAQRAAIANTAGADAFVSIHANAFNDPSYAGVTTFYGAPSGFAGSVTRSAGLVQDGQNLAQAVQTSVQRQTGAVNGGVQPAAFYVLGYTQMPSILIETGYMTNPAELQRLETPSYQQQIAYGIVLGLERYFNASVVPSTTPSSGTTTSTTTAGSNYTVQPGDTLSGIALQLGVNEATLASLNGLNAVDAIYAGQRLVLPNQTGTAATTPSSAGGTTYTVQPGDTVSGIAVRFGVSESALASQNKLNAGDAIYAGQQLVLPDSVGASPTPLTPGRQHTYVIQPGDTLSGIAAQFGVSENALAAQNGIQDPNRIVAGTTLTVPA